jgi:hypothetical protein
MITCFSSPFVPAALVTAVQLAAANVELASKTKLPTAGQAITRVFVGVKNARN